jgi:phosphatidate cytidylyltransferase
MTRVLTAALGILLVLAVTLWDLDWAFVLVVLLVAALGLDEFLAMASRRGWRRPGRWALVPGVAVTLAFRLDPQWIVWALAGNLFLLSIVSIASGRGAEHLEYLAFGAAGTIYACMLPGFLLLLSPQSIWVLLATVWAGDTAAFYGGRLLGRHRLAPVVSPNKTVEGAIAGGLASIVAGTAVGYAVLGASVPALIGLCLLTGAAGQLGDLVESAMKRTAGIKDSSRRLPGHGGVLDRVDSLLFAAPVFGFCMTWIR